MTFPFQPQQGLILVLAEIEGPLGTVGLRLALDTGATATLVEPRLLLMAGIDPTLAPVQIQLTTASGVLLASLLTVTKLKALGQDRPLFPILAHTLPASTSIDGLLGLDFFRGQRLLIDFRNGTITLT